MHLGGFTTTALQKAQVVGSHLTLPGAAADCCFAHHPFFSAWGKESPFADVCEYISALYPLGRTLSAPLAQSCIRMTGRTRDKLFACQDGTWPQKRLWTRCGPIPSLTLSREDPSSLTACLTHKNCTLRPATPLLLWKRFASGVWLPLAQDGQGKAGQSFPGRGDTACGDIDGRHPNRLCHQSGALCEH